MSRDDRHEHLNRYWAFICEAWAGIRPLLAPKAGLVCRIGGRGRSAVDLREALTASMRFLANRWELTSCEESTIRKRQTDVFRPVPPGVASSLICALRYSSESSPVAVIAAPSARSDDLIRPVDALAKLLE